MLDDRENWTEMGNKLKKLAQKGLLYRLREGETVRYSAIPFIHGLLEFQTPMPKELVSLTAKHDILITFQLVVGSDFGGRKYLLHIQTTRIVSVNRPMTA